MAHVKIDFPEREGKFVGHWCRMALNGKEMTEVTDIDISIGVDSAVTIRSRMFVEAPFEFETEDASVHLHFTAPPGCYVEAEDLGEGKRRYSFKRRQPDLSWNEPDTSSI